MPRKSTHAADYQDAPSPVAVMAKEVPSHHRVSWHKHKRAQLIYAAQGVLTVNSREGTWVIPPQRGVWVPAGIEHETIAAGAVALRTVYVAPGKTKGLPIACCVVTVSPLLRELILRAASFPLGYEARGPEARVMQLILDEIRISWTLPLHLPIASHPRLASMCLAIMNEPKRGGTLEDWSKRVGMSSRTVARLFRRHTGMTYGNWCQQARLLSALRRLAAGQSVKRVALEVGYTSPSAFTSMFKRAFGTSPSNYFAEPSAGAKPNPIRAAARRFS
jgi:AraC-like DNA-binding protein/mannose-6-phosphate isomerase-like protein (cupin superfamily)